MTKQLDTAPHFASEAQQVFTAGERVFAVADTVAVLKGAEGVYAGKYDTFAVVDWDTPSGEPYRESVEFDKIKSLYR